MRVICIGECMVEFRAVDSDRFARSYAGDAYNTAIYLKRSLPGAEVCFLSATGDDPVSQAMRRDWRAQEIDDSLTFTVSGGSPGLYVIENDTLGERRFQYWRSNSAARRWLALLQEHGESILWGADILYLSGITLAVLNPEERPRAIELMRRLRSRVGRIAFDPNVRMVLWETPESAASTIAAAMSACDIALPSTEDLKLLFNIEEPQQQLDLLREWSVHEVALTLGPDGCAIADGESRTRLPAPKVTGVIDTSGAGDAFNGAYLAGRLLGNSPAQAAREGLIVASRVVTHAGAIVPGSVSHGPVTGVLPI